ncbi:MAG: hypothetical protein ABTD50_20145 [Polyangiaceae bacterium]|jgi:hypothetical protein
MPISKRDAARVLADAHYRIEDGLERVFIIPAGLEDPREPIKLLEVNANTIPTGSIEPIPFSASREIPFVTEIAEISPEEFSKLERGELSLPPGWTLEGADDVPRPRAA